MITRTATVRNTQGIHCRPSAVILKAGEAYPGEIRIANENGETRLGSVLELLALDMQQDSEVTISVSGPDEDSVCNEIVNLFETEFDFPPREVGEEEPEKREYWRYQP